MAGAVRVGRGASRASRQVRAGLAYFGSRWRLWSFAALINALLFAAFLWSRPGSTTTLRLEALGSDFRAYVDGKLHGQASYDDFPTGGIGLQLPAEDSIPSLPGPPKLESVKVRDATSSDILFEDSFDEGETGPWVVSQGEWARRGGAYWTPTGGTVTTGYQPWGDYVLEATFSNLTDVAFFVRVQDSGDAVVYAFRPYRNFDSAFFLRKGGAYTQAVGGSTVEVSRVETVRSILGIALRPYPTLGLLALGAVLVLGVSALVRQDRRLASVGQRWSSRWVEPIAWGSAIAAFGILLYLIYVVGDHMPHVPDSVAYLFQAKIFASFRLFAKAPEYGEHFFIGIDTPIQYAGRWFTTWPFGHPAALAVGQKLGAPWLIPPLLGALTVFLVYRVGRHVYGAGTGLLAAILLLLSPFFQMTGSNFMSHNTASFYLIGATLFYVRPTGRPALSWFMSGVFLGLLFNTRPLTTAGVLVPFALWAVYDLWRSQDRRAVFRRGLALTAGFGLLLLFYFLYNRALTGSFTTPPYSFTSFTRDNVGFFGSHSLAAGLMNDQTNLSLLVLVLNGWPLASGLLFVFLPFVLGSRNRWDYFFLFGALFIAAAWTAFRGVFIMHGPRFWYEMVPFLMLLSARGVQCLVNFVGDAASWLGTRLRFLRGVEARATAGLAAYTLVAALLAYSIHGWMLGKHNGWPPIEFVPRKASELEGFNSTDDRLLELVERRDIHDALVLVKQCPHWWCYGSVFWKNDPDLDGDIVYALDLGPEKNAALIQEFPGRSVYLADYERRSMEPYAAAAQAPPSPAPAPTPAPADGSSRRSERDSRRQQDLERIREALGEYRARFGAYPSTGGGVQTLCAYVELDAGCALRKVLPGLPQDPLGDPLTNGYWYASDGERFSLFAVQEGEADAGLSSCPFYSPGSLDPRVGYCLSGPP